MESVRAWVSLAMMEEEEEDGGELGLSLDLDSEGMTRFYLGRIVLPCA